MNTAISNMSTERLTIIILTQNFLEVNLRNFKDWLMINFIYRIGAVPRGLQQHIYRYQMQAPLFYVPLCNQISRQS